jgi:hypothetical protein
VLIPIVGTGIVSAYIFNSPPILTLTSIAALIALGVPDQIPMGTPIVPEQPRRQGPLTGIQRFGILCWWAGVTIGALFILPDWPAARPQLMAKSSCHISESRGRSATALRALLNQSRALFFSPLVKISPAEGKASTVLCCYIIPLFGPYVITLRARRIPCRCQGREDFAWIAEPCPSRWCRCLTTISPIGCVSGARFGSAAHRGET